MSNQQSAAQQPNIVLQSPPAEREGGIELRVIVDILNRSKYLIISIMIGTLVVVGLVTYKQTRIYEGVCTIEYDPMPPRPLGREVEGVYDPLINLWMSREWYETQNRVLASQTIAEIVVQKLGLHENPEFTGAKSSRNKSTPTTVQQAARILRARITIEQEKDTRIVRIKVWDKNPTTAQLLSNTLADAYIEKMMQDKTGTTIHALEWLSDQLDNLKRDLESSELALHNFKRDNNVLSLSMEERQNIVANDIQSFSEALTDIRAKRIEVGARLDELKKMREMEPLDTPIVFQNDIIRELKKEYGEKSSDRNQLSVKLGAEHPELKSLDARLSSTRQQLEREINGLIQSAESDLHQVVKTEAGLRAALRQAHKDGLELNLREIQYDRLRRTRENNAKLYNLVLQRTTETDLTRMFKVSNVRVLDRALRPTAPIKPNLQFNLSIGLLAGLLLGLGTAVLVARLDRSVKSLEDIEAAGLTVLGFVPEVGFVSSKKKKKKGRSISSNIEPQGSPDLIVHDKPKSSVAECCRNIRTNLMFMSPDKPLRTLVISSGAPKEGKTTVAISLAIAMAQSGKRILLVDTDLRRPRIHRAFGLRSTLGVTSVLVGECTLMNAVQETKVPNLYIIPCGPVPPTPSELLHTKKFNELIKNAETEFDCVLFDSPPLGAVTDAAIIGPQVDGVILIAKSGRTSRDTLRTSLKQMRDVSARVVGGVVNAVSPQEQRVRYGYYYYYYKSGYYSTDDNEPKMAAPVT